MLHRVADVRTAIFGSVRQLLVKASVVPISLILFNLMKEALISSETSVLTRDPLRNVLDDAILTAIMFWLRLYIYIYIYN
jgi:hypothetical protein